MTPNEAKDAHDRIWAVMEKITLCRITKGRFQNGSWYLMINYTLGLTMKGKTFDTKAEVNQFLKEIE